MNKFRSEGEDGEDFITVEHCGDDFLAALAESMADQEDWDDLQAMEVEGCGAVEVGGCGREYVGDGPEGRDFFFDDAPDEILSFHGESPNAGCGIPSRPAACFSAGKKLDRNGVGRYVSSDNKVSFVYCCCFFS